MTKTEFLDQLRARLNGLPEQEINDHIMFYDEMISDRAEDAGSEETAIEELGSVDEVVARILSEYSVTEIVAKRMKTRRKRGTLGTVLIALGSPVWISLLAAVIAVYIALFAAVFSVFASLWAVELALILSCPGSLLLFIMNCAKGIFSTAFAWLGAGLCCGGLAILMMYVCKAVTKAAAVITRSTVSLTKRLIIGKGK